MKRRGIVALLAAVMVIAGSVYAMLILTDLSFCPHILRTDRRTHQWRMSALS